MKLNLQKIVSLCKKNWHHLTHFVEFLWKTTPKGWLAAIAVVLVVGGSFVFSNLSDQFRGQMYISCAENEEYVNGICKKKAYITCPEGQEYRNGTCSPRAFVIECGENETLVNGRCKKNAIMLDDPSPKVYHTTCGSNEFWNDTTKRCQKKSISITCPEGTKWTGSQCKKTHYEIECPEGTEWTGGSCKKTHYEINCPEGTVWNGGRCMKKAYTVCPKGQTNQNDTCVTPKVVQLSPASGTELKVGRKWKFDWETVPGATAYNLVILKKDSNEFFNESNLTISEQEMFVPFNLVEDYNYGPWSWHLRAFVNGGWTDWERTDFAVYKACPDSYIKVANECVCPDGKVESDNRCVDPTLKPAAPELPVLCEYPYVAKNGSCELELSVVCPQGQVYQNGECVWSLTPFNPTPTPTPKPEPKPKPPVTPPGPVAKPAAPTLLSPAQNGTVDGGGTVTFKWKTEPGNYYWFVLKNERNQTLAEVRDTTKGEWSGKVDTNYVSRERMENWQWSVAARGMREWSDWSSRTVRVVPQCASDKVFDSLNKICTSKTTPTPPAPQPPVVPPTPPVNNVYSLELDPKLTEDAYGRVNAKVTVRNIGVTPFNSGNNLYFRVENLTDGRTTDYEFNTRSGYSVVSLRPGQRSQEFNLYNLPLTEYRGQKSFKFTLWDRNSSLASITEAIYYVVRNSVYRPAPIYPGGAVPPNVRAYGDEIVLKGIVKVYKGRFVVVDPEDKLIAYLTGFTGLDLDRYTNRGVAVQGFVTRQSCSGTDFHVKSLRALRQGEKLGNSLDELYKAGVICFRDVDTRLQIKKSPTNKTELNFVTGESAPWYFKYAREMFERGIMKGDKGLFFPARSVTIAEISKMAIEAAEIKVTDESKRPKGSHWAHYYLNYAGRYDLLPRESLRDPNKKATREEVMMAIMKVFEIDPRYKSRKFPDLDYRREGSAYIEKARELGIVSGYPDGMFRPWKEINRAETAKILSNAINKLSR